jgi:hypothetical protein
MAKYRFLKAGEKLLSTDEFQNKQKGWVLTELPGTYTTHSNEKECHYRRKVRERKTSTRWSVSQCSGRIVYIGKNEIFDLSNQAIVNLLNSKNISYKRTA